jgi:hypothetical protein
MASAASRLALRTPRSSVAGTYRAITTTPYSQLRAKPFSTQSQNVLLKNQKLIPVVSGLNSLSPSRFSTMTSLKSAQNPAPSEGRAYDPEIKDMASYIHHYKIDSDLAVSVYHFLLEQ